MYFLKKYIDQDNVKWKRELDKNAQNRDPEMDSYIHMIVFEALKIAQI